MADRAGDLGVCVLLRALLHNPHTRKQKQNNARNMTLPCTLGADTSLEFQKNLGPSIPFFVSWKRVDPAPPQTIVGISRK